MKIKKQNMSSLVSPPTAKQRGMNKGSASNASLVQGFLVKESVLGKGPKIFTYSFKSTKSSFKSSIRIINMINITYVPWFLSVVCLSPTVHLHYQS